MLILTIAVDTLAGSALGVKEAIAQDLEKYGDVRVISVEEERPEQMRIGSIKWDGR